MRYREETLPGLCPEPECGLTVDEFAKLTAPPQPSPDNPRGWTPEDLAMLVKALAPVLVAILGQVFGLAPERSVGSVLEPH